MRASGEEGKPEVTATYRLEQQSPVLTLETVYRNAGTAPITVNLQDDLRIGSGKEDLDTAPERDRRRLLDRRPLLGTGVRRPGATGRSSPIVPAPRPLKYVDGDQKKPRRPSPSGNRSGSSAPRGRQDRLRPPARP